MSKARANAEQRQGLSKPARRARPRQARASSAPGARPGRNATLAKPKRR
jgi:hypothetical protein